MICDFVLSKVFWIERKPPAHISGWLIYVDFYVSVYLQVIAKPCDYVPSTPTPDLRSIGRTFQWAHQRGVCRPLIIKLMCCVRARKDNASRLLWLTAWQLYCRCMLGAWWRQLSESSTLHPLFIWVELVTLFGTINPGLEVFFRLSAQQVCRSQAERNLLWWGEGKLLSPSFTLLVTSKSAHYRVEKPSNLPCSN